MHSITLFDSCTQLRREGPGVGAGGEAVLCKRTDSLVAGMSDLLV